MAQILLLICDHSKHPETERVEGNRHHVVVDGLVLRVDACPPCWAPFEAALATLTEMGETMRFGINVDAIIAERERTKDHSRAVDRDTKRQKRSVSGDVPTRAAGTPRMTITREPDLADDESDENGMWPCGYCDAPAFPSKTSRGSHRFRGHGIRKNPLRFQCIYCDHGSPDFSDVSHHVRRTHPDKRDEWNALPKNEQAIPITRDSTRELEAV